MSPKSNIWRGMSACCGSTTTSIANGLLILNDNTLMVNDLPSPLRSLPDNGTSCLTSFVLQETVCQKVNIRSKPSAQKVARFTRIGLAGGEATFEFVERQLARVECARSTHLPKSSAVIFPKSARVIPNSGRWKMGSPLDNSVSNGACSGSVMR